MTSHGSSSSISSLIESSRAPLRCIREALCGDMLKETDMLVIGSSFDLCLGLSPAGAGPRAQIPTAGATAESSAGTSLIVDSALAPMTTGVAGQLSCGSADAHCDPIDAKAGDERDEAVLPIFPEVRRRESDATSACASEYDSSISSARDPSLLALDSPRAPLHCASQDTVFMCGSSCRKSIAETDVTDSGNSDASPAGAALYDSELVKREADELLFGRCPALPEDELEPGRVLHCFL